MAKNSGKQFEELFALYMILHLDIATTERNHPQKGNTSVQPWDCDIHGVFRSKFWRALYFVALAVMALGVGSLMLPEYCGTAAHDAGRRVESLLGPTTRGFGEIIFGALVFTVAVLGQRRTTRHIWVECKDLESSVKRDHMNKLVAAANDVRDCRDAKWKPDELWFASSGRYSPDAINFARKHGIRCFQQLPGEEAQFEQVGL